MKFIVFSVVLVLALAAIGLLFQHNSAGTRRNMSTSGADWCKRQEDCIEEAVYKYQIENSEGHSPAGLFFLSKDQSQDPDSEVVKRLESSSKRVKPISQSVNLHTVIKDKHTGELGVVLKVGKMKWLDGTRVDVELSAYSGWGDVKGYVYHLMRGERGWIVRDREFAFES